MDTAKLLLGIGFFLAVAGFFPWLLEKRGINVPHWLILWCGIVAIGALASCLYYGFHPNLIGAAVISFGAGVAATWWWTYGPSTPQSITYDYRKWSSDKIETISRRSYFNETVEIDGKQFDHCEFTNVKLLYHGLANTTFIESKFSGSMVLQTDNQAAKGFAALAEHFRGHPNVTSFVVGEVDEKGNIRIIKKETHEKTPDGEKQQLNPPKP